MNSIFNDCEIWNSDKFWNNQIPIFPVCLVNSFIRWLPSVFMIIGFLIGIKSFIKQYSYEDVNLNYHLKRSTLFLLSIGCLIELFYFNQFDNNTLFVLKTISSIIELISYLITILLFIRPRNKLRLSCLLLLYSFILLITSLIRLYSYFIEYFNFNHTVEKYSETIQLSYSIYLIIYGALVLCFFLFHFCKDSKLPIDKINCPIYYSSFLSRATFWWLNPTIFKSFKNLIKEDDLFELHYSHKANFIYKRFSRFYRKNLDKKNNKNNNFNLNNNKLINENKFDKIHFKNVISDVLDKNGLTKNKLNGSFKLDDDIKNQKFHYEYLLNRPPKCSFVGPLFQTFWKEFLIVASLRLVALCIQFLNPIILDFILTYINNGGPLFEGITYGLMMFIVTLLYSLFNNQYELKINIVGMKIRSVLTMAIYKKILILSSTGRSVFETGKIVNLMGADCERIFEFIVMANQLWACLFQIVVSLLMIYNKINLGVLGAIFGSWIFYLILIPISFSYSIIVPWNSWVTRRIKKFQSIEMGYKDERINMLSEILNGIKVLKLYAWEHDFKDYLSKIRNIELSYLKKKAIMQICMTQSYTVVPFSIVFCCLVSFVMIYPNEVLTANKTFVIVSLVNILKSPLSSLPNILSNWVMSKIAVKRINEFLSEDEIQPDSIQRTNNSECKDAIVVKNASFIWNVNTNTKPVLKDIQLKIKRNQLIAVVGSIASGKSSLLSALLNDMHKIKGEININGTIAYVSQQAWVLNDKFKQNILFGNEFNKEKYLDVLSKCQLLPDLKLLAAGDETEIGEKGINLSGGQKQRVNIARAVYADRDIYLFDDPLSALDSNVGKEIFDKIISNKGLLKDKTRILVTHKINLLDKVDKIVVLKDGMITEFGTYNDLIKTKGDFSEFCQNVTNEIPNLDSNNKQDQEQILKSRSNSLQNSLYRRSSLSSSKSTVSRNQDQINGSISSRKSYRTNSIKSIVKTFDDFENDTFNDVEEEKNLDEQHEKNEKQLELMKDKSKLTESEKIKSGSISIKTYKEYLKEFNSFLFVLVILFFLIAYAFNYFASIWLSIWTDDSKHVEIANDSNNRNFRILIYLLLGIAESVFILTAMIILTKGCLRAAKRVHDNMVLCLIFAHRLCISLILLLWGEYYLDFQRVSNKILKNSIFFTNPFSKDLDSLNTLICMNFRSFLNSCLKTSVSLLIISTKTPAIMLFVLPVLIVYYVFQLIYVRTKRQLVRINLASKSPIYSIYQETINGSNSIRAYGLEKEFELSCSQKIDLNSLSHIPSVVASRWLTFRLEFLGNVIVFICVVFVVINRDLIDSAALVGLTITSALTINQTFNNLIRRLSDLENNVVSIERCLEYTNLEKEDNLPEEKNNLTSWPELGNVKFINFSTKYRPHLDFVLNNINFEIKPMEKIGIVGRTGAGKSTITLTLFRIIEAYNGSIEIDGEKISDLSLHCLRSKLSIIPQDPVLFTGSLRLNLDPLTEKAQSDCKHLKAKKDDELWLALEQAHLKDFILTCDGGLDFHIQEGGENLSVGQRQLICLARALLRKSKILILDEATANCDPKTDELIQTTIKKQFADCTIITIAHRLNTICSGYDKILVLDSGRIAEFDTVKNLLANKNSIFYSMARDSELNLN